MTKTTSTYTQPHPGQYFMDVLISPETLKSGALLERLNVRAYPKVGVHVGITTTVVVVAAPSGSQQESTALLLTATITPSETNGPVDGAVTFKNGVTVLGTSLAYRGVATLHTSHLPVGSDSLTVDYAGNGEYLASTSGALVETVTTDASTTTLVVTPSGSRSSTTVLTFTATVVPASATGTVTFKDGVTTVDTASLVDGVATITATLPTGSASLTAVYAGDSLVSTSTSSAVVKTITATASATGLAVTPADPQAAATTLTMTATVSPDTATGTVTFLDGLTTVGTGPLVAGVASADTTLLAGEHSLTAVYGGDLVFATSTSTAVPRTAT